MGSDKGFRTEKRSLTDGTVLWTQTGQGGHAQAVATDSSGVYTVGYDAPANNTEDAEWRIEKRSLTDGILQWVQTENIATAVSSFDNQDHARDVAADSSGTYIVGMDTIQGSNNNCEWRIEKRTA